MSSDTDDEFARMVKDLGFEVEETTEESVSIDYTYVVVNYTDDNGYPITVRVEYPVGQAMDAARALVVSATSDSIQQLIAGATMHGDASTTGYLEANGIDPAKYIEDTFDGASEDAPPLSDADEFFTLDK